MSGFIESGYMRDDMDTFPIIRPYFMGLEIKDSILKMGLLKEPSDNRQLKNKNGTLEN